MYWIAGLLSLTYFLYPLILGRGLVVGGFIFNSLFKGKKNRNVSESIWSLPAYFGLGLLMMFGYALVLAGVGIAGEVFAWLYFGGVMLALFLSVLLNVWHWPKVSFGKLKSFGLGLAGLAVIAGVSFGVWSYNNPYPLNWDFYQHQQLARLIREGEFNFLTTRMSDTFGFNSYPPLFHVPLSVSQWPIQLTPDFILSYWRVMEFWQVTLVGVAAFGLGYGVSGKKEVGWLAALLSGLIFDPMVSLTTYFFMPQTLAAVLFTGYMARLLRAYDHKHIVGVGEVIIAVLSLGLMHYLVGGVGALIYLGVYGYLALGTRWPDFSKGMPWVALVVLITLGGVLVAPYVPLDSLNSGEAADYLFTLGDKQEVLERAMGYLGYLTIPLGLVYAVQKKKMVIWVALLIAFGLSGVVLAEIPYSLKIVSLLRFWLVVVAAMGLFELIQFMRNRMIKGLVFGVIMIGLLVILATNLMYWQAGIMAEGKYSHLSQDDMKLVWLVEKAFGNRKVRVVSDPATQFIIEGLTVADSIGGSYMIAEKREALAQPIESHDARAVVSAAQLLEDGVDQDEEVRLLVLSGRTFLWARQEPEKRNSFGYNVWSPVDLTIEDYQLIEKIETLTGVQKVHESAYAVVFKIGN